MTFFSCMNRPGVAPDTNDSIRRMSGLRNPTGTTCHLNAVIQALYMTPELRSELLCCQAADLPPTGKAVINVFSQLAQGGRTVSTKTLSNALKPIHVCTRQQDCHDTWLVLCDQLDRSLKDTSQAKLMSQLFEGKQLDYVRCHACGSVSDTKDTYSCLALAVPNGNVADDDESDDDKESEDDAEEGEGEGEGQAAAEAIDAQSTTEKGIELTAVVASRDGEAGEGEGSEGGSGEGGGGKPAVHTVAKGIAQLFQAEQMRGEDQYECDKCKGKQDAERGVRVQTLPPIVTIHLKRFAIQTSTDRRGRAEMSLVKLNTAVRFPKTLDFSTLLPSHPVVAAPTSHGEDGKTAAEDSASEPGASSSGERGEGGETKGAAEDAEKAEGEKGSLVYDLYAVLLHTGNLEKGHYYALIKDVEDGAWHRFDDEKVVRLTAPELARELRRAYGGPGSTSAYMLLYRQRPAHSDDAQAPEDNVDWLNPVGNTSSSVASGSLEAAVDAAASSGATATVAPQSVGPAA